MYCRPHGYPTALLISYSIGHQQQKTATSGQFIKPAQLLWNLPGSGSLWVQFKPRQ